MSAVKEKYFEAVGRRKTSVARVRVIPTSGKAALTINEKPLNVYFPTEELRHTVSRALTTSEMDGAVTISAKITGGGIHSQAEALCHGIARALTKYKGELRSPLKQAKLLTRDSRMKERRKFGLKKARKSPQWSKR